MPLCGHCRSSNENATNPVTNKTTKHLPTLLRSFPQCLSFVSISVHNMHVWPLTTVQQLMIHSSGAVPRALCHDTSGDLLGRHCITSRFVRWLVSEALAITSIA